MLRYLLVNIVKCITQTTLCISYCNQRKSRCKPSQILLLRTNSNDFSQPVQILKLTYVFLYFTSFTWCWPWMNFPAFPKVNFVRHFPTHNYDHKYICTHTLLAFTFSSNFTRIRICTKDEQNHKLYRKAEGNPNVYKILKTYILSSSSSPVYRQHIYINLSGFNMDMWSHRSLATYGHRVLPRGPLALGGPCRAATPQWTSRRAGACFCCHWLLWRKAGFGISIRKRWALSANREWDCEFQWTSEKVNLRLDVSLRAAAAALGQLQSKTWVFFNHSRERFFSISPDVHKPSYIRWLLCPKTYIIKSYGHRCCYSFYLNVTYSQP